MTGFDRVWTMVAGSEPDIEPSMPESLSETPLYPNHVDYNAIGSHPALRAAQAELRVQLEASRQRLLDELREAEVVAKAAERSKEDAGVELYGLQQRTAELEAQHGALTKSIEECSQSRALASRALEAKEDELRLVEKQVSDSRAAWLEDRRLRDESLAKAKENATATQEARWSKTRAKDATARAVREIGMAERNAASEQGALESLQEQLSVVHSVIDLHRVAIEEQVSLRRSVGERRSALDLELGNIRQTTKRLKAECSRLAGVVTSRENARASVLQAGVEVQDRILQAKITAKGQKGALLHLNANAAQLRRLQQQAESQSRALQDKLSQLQRQLESVHSRHAEQLAQLKHYEEDILGQQEQIRQAVLRTEAAQRAKQAAELEAQAVNQQLDEIAAKSGLEDVKRIALLREISAVQQQIHIEKARQALVEKRTLICLEGPLKQAQESITNLEREASRLEKELQDKEKQLVAQEQHLAKLRSEEEQVLKATGHLLARSQNGTHQEGRAYPLQELKDDLQDRLHRLQDQITEARKTKRQAEVGYSKVQTMLHHIAEARARIREKHTLLAARTVFLNRDLERARGSTRQHQESLETLHRRLQESGLRIAALQSEATAQIEREFSIRFSHLDDVARLEALSDKLRRHVERMKGKEAATKVAIGVASERLAELGRELAELRALSAKGEGTAHGKLEQRCVERRALRAELDSLTKQQVELGRSLANTIRRRGVITDKVRASQLKRVQEQSAESLRKQLTELERAMRHARSELVQLSEAVSRRDFDSQRLNLDLQRARTVVSQLVARAAELEESCATRSLQTQAAMLWTAASQKTAQAIAQPPPSPKQQQASPQQLAVAQSRLQMLQTCLAEVLGSRSRCAPSLQLAQIVLELTVRCETAQDQPLPAAETTDKAAYLTANAIPGSAKHQQLPRYEAADSSDDLIAAHHPRDGGDA